MEYYFHLHRLIHIHNNMHTLFFHLLLIYKFVIFFHPYYELKIRYNSIPTTFPFCKCPYISFTIHTSCFRRKPYFCKILLGNASYAAATAKQSKIVSKTCACLASLALLLRIIANRRRWLGRLQLFLFSTQFIPKLAERSF